MLSGRMNGRLFMDNVLSWKGSGKCGRFEEGQVVN